MNAVCTLFEGHYHLGAGALVNSLHACGFTGRIVCGHRGSLPAWGEAAQRIRGDFEVRFVRLETQSHLTYHKPEFMLRCWSEYCQGASQLHYLDPDIVVKAPWATMERWAQDGIALCEDVNANLPSGHPYRLQWTDFLVHHGMRAARPMERYYNAGYVGVPRSAIGFVRIWAKIIDDAGLELGGLTKLKNDQPHALFHSADQDALNMALMCTEVPINASGPEGMDFLPGGHLLSHAIGGAKPWRGGFLREALRGRPPGKAQKTFFRFAESPLRLIAPQELRRMKASLSLGALVGRVYRRS
jgi:hypothetical protein